MAYSGAGTSKSAVSGMRRVYRKYTLCPREISPLARVLLQASIPPTTGLHLLVFIISSFILLNNYTLDG